MNELQERIYTLTSCLNAAEHARNALQAGLFACLPKQESKGYANAFRAADDLVNDLRGHLSVVQKEQRFTFTAEANND